MHVSKGGGIRGLDEKTYRVIGQDIVDWGQGMVVSAKQSTHCNAKGLLLHALLGLKP